jgi:uncharacterized protein
MRFEEMPPIEIDPAAAKRGLRLGCGLFAVLAIIVVLLQSLGPITDYIWYSQDARHPEVFTLAYAVRGTLFLIAFIPSLLLLLWSLTRALKVSMIFLDRPMTVGQVMATRAFDAIGAFGPLVTRIAAVVLAFFASMGFSNEWNTYLMWRNAQSFGRTDPIFGMDLGFFVFQLPWWLSVLNFVFGLLVLVTISTIGVYVGLQSLAALARIELGRPAIRAHLSVLAGTTVLIFGIQLWMRRYEFGLVDSSQFTGAGYAASIQLMIQTWIAPAVILVGLLTIVNGRLGSGYRLPLMAGGAVAVLAVLGLAVTPGIVQGVFVNPNKLQVESPYAKRAIEATRFAYGLETIDSASIEVQDAPTQQEIADAKDTLDNMRLWDPDVMRQAIEPLQGLRPYYTFADVDIDRYVIDGEQRMVMLSPRDINTDGLAENARSWVNTRLQYTHGYGLTMSPVNTSSPEGQPTFLVRNMPVRSHPDIPVEQPRLYFSDFRGPLEHMSNRYVLVNSAVDEFDYPGEGNDQNYRWTGNRGVHIGAFMTKLAYSIRLADGNLLVSPNIKSDTRLLYRRGITERAQMVYPFLQFDSDPYVVVLNGRLVWIMDGYTTTNRIPYSARVTGSRASVNYIRNPVKLTIDAYSGEMVAYAIDPNEPILKAYRQIYPRLIRDGSEAPPELVRHYRYPEDMFMLQAYQLTQYHVTQPVPFLNNEDAWDLPTERGLRGTESAMRAYYVQMRLPDEKEDGFHLILPFTPRRKVNMSGWLAAYCDPGQYGKLKLYRYPKGSNVPGPKQMEARFNQDQTIARINRELNNEQSRIIPGNLLVIPVGRSVLYAEPLFLQSISAGIQPIPELRKVILALQGRIEVADTYAEALKNLLGTAANQVREEPDETGQPTPPADTGTTPAAAIPRERVRELLRLAEEADAALRTGDFGRYGELQRKLKEALRELSE